MTFDPTPQQQAIYDTVRSSQSHPVVSARAGCGKTTTAVASAAFANPVDVVGFVAFNRHIADELQSKLGYRATACTLHKLGVTTVRQAFPEVRVDGEKLKKLAKEMANGIHFRDVALAKQLVRLCKCTLTKPLPHALDDICDHFNLDVPREPEQCYKFAARLYDASQKQTHVIDFDDMVWFPRVYELRPSQFDLLMVDECQDLNSAQRELAWSACRGRLMPIGDVKQSLYGFTGSDPDSMPALIKFLRNRPEKSVELPLTVTWRCPASHVALANRLVPDLEAASTAIDGTVEVLSSDPEESSYRPGDMVICRRNAPLVGLAYRLLAAGVKTRVRGRDIGTGILSLIDSLDVTTISDLLVAIEDYCEKAEKSLLRRDASAQAFESLHDRCDCVRELALAAPDLNSLRGRIKHLFNDDAPDGDHVILSSVHRAKGLEADRVVILEAWRMPMVWKNQKAWEAQQERNILYVALTRSKRDLVLVGLPEILQ